MTVTREAVPPSSNTILAIILGAHEWPDMPSLDASDSFSLSAAAFERYLRDSSGLGLPQSCIKNLFDTDLLAQEVDREIKQFITRHYVNGAPNFTDLIVYYTGHGDFTRREQHFQLILKSTREDNLDYAGYTMRQLAGTINAVARKPRKLVILDCCYAGAAFGDWQMQSVDATAALHKSIEEQAAETFVDAPDVTGTALMCACNATQLAFFKPGDLTTFSGGLIRALTEGSDDAGRALSIGDVYKLTKRAIVNRNQPVAVLPVMYVPKGQQEEMTSYGLFPNPARVDPAGRRVAMLEEALARFGQQTAEHATRLGKLQGSLDEMQASVGELTVLRSAYESQNAEISSMKESLASTAKRLEDSAALSSYGVSGIPDEVWASCPDSLRRTYLVWQEAQQNGSYLRLIALGALVAVVFGVLVEYLTEGVDRALILGAQVVVDTFALVFALLFVWSLAITILTSRRRVYASGADVPLQEPKWQSNPQILRAQTEPPIGFVGWPVSRSAFVMTGLLTILSLSVTGFSVYTFLSRGYFF